MDFLNDVAKLSWNLCFIRFETFQALKLGQTYYQEKSNCNVIIISNMTRQSAKINFNMLIPISNHLHVKCNLYFQYDATIGKIDFKHCVVWHKDWRWLELILRKFQGKKHMTHHRVWNSFLPIISSHHIGNKDYIGGDWKIFYNLVEKNSNVETLTLCN